MSGEKPRVPPGQYETEEFPVLHVGRIPVFDPATWDFCVTGAVNKELRFTWNEFLALPKVEDESDFHCVTTWSRLGNKWVGVRFVDIIRMSEPKSEAVSVMFYCDGGYTTSILLKDLRDEDILLAYGLDGQQLTPDHGFPLRLVVPKLYAYKSAKWVRQADFMTKHWLGYWEQLGYSDSADPWKEERYSKK